MSIKINQSIKSLFILIFFISLNSFSQEKSKKHKIQKGETITSIAKKNNISIKEIYDLNPNVNKVLKLNSILLIPFSNNKKEKKTIKIEDEIKVDLVHQAAPKETLYGISKKYKISIENLKKWNPILENSSLEIGQVINIAENRSSKSKELEILKPQLVTKSETIIHEVLAKETLYSIAKKYKTSIQKLKELNPETENGLAIGYKLIISQSKSYDKIDKTEIEEIKPKTQIETVIVKSDSIITVPKSEEEKIITKEIEPLIIQSNDTLAQAIPISNLELSEQLFLRGSEQIGSRYRTGGTQPGAFDCSGLMIYIYQDSGVKLPRTSAEQSRFGTKINNYEAQQGDLIFFSTNRRGNVNHVGMVTENIDGEIKFIHSSVHGGVIISSLSEKYYSNKIKHINRVLE